MLIFNFNPKVYHTTKCNFFNSFFLFQFPYEPSDQIKEPKQLTSNKAIRYFFTMKKELGD